MTGFLMDYNYLYCLITKLCIVPALLVEGFGGGASQGGGGGIEVGDGALVIIGLQKEAFCGTGAEAVWVEMEAEAEVKAVRQELLHLLRFAAKSMPDPRLGGTAMEAENIIYSADTMEDEGTAEALAEVDLCLEDSQLERVGCRAEAVEAALAYERWDLGIMVE